MGSPRPALAALAALAVLALRAHAYQPSKDSSGPTRFATAEPPRPGQPGQPSPDDVARLKSILTERDTMVRPDLEATVVNVSLGIRHITLNEMQSTMSVSAWVKMEWVDRRMQMLWQNSSAPAFQAIKVLYVNSESIWHPDIALKNSLSGRGASVMDGSGAVLHQDGRVVWAPAALLEAYCQLDLRRWPFERNECELHLGSGTLDMSQLKFGAIGHKHEFPGQTAGEFIVDWIRETPEETAEPGYDKPFDGVLYSFALHREPGTYHAVIFTPAAVVIILCLATFLLPPRAGEKVILGGVNAMLVCLFLIYFAHSLPVLTNQTPLIVVFYSASLYMVCLSLVVAVLVLNLSRQPHARGLPWALKQALTGSLGRFLLLSGYIEQIMGVDHGPCGGRSSDGGQEELPVVFHDEMASGAGDRSSVASMASLGAGCAGAAGSARCGAEIGSRRADPNQDWLLLAAAVDRVLFLVYAVLFVVLAVAFQV